MPRVLSAVFPLQWLQELKFRLLNSTLLDGIPSKEFQIHLCKETILQNWRINLPQILLLFLQASETPPPPDRDYFLCRGPNGDGCLHGKTIPVSLLNVLPFRSISVRLLTLALLKDSYGRSKKLGLILFIWEIRAKPDMTRQGHLCSALSRWGWMQENRLEAFATHWSEDSLPWYKIGSRHWK